MKYRLGVDLGGTKILMCLVNERGEYVGERKIDSRSLDGPKKVLSYLFDGINKFLQEENIPQQNLEGAGICVAGFYYFPSGKMVSSPNLPGWDDFPLEEELKKNLDCPVLVENDANAAAFGEYTQGAGKSRKNIFLFTLGTGIGGGMVLDGKIYRGSGGFAGEIGHITLMPEGELCGCGKRGCLETLSSGKAIEREAKKIFRSSSHTILKELVTEEKELKASDVFDAAEKGDEESEKIIDRAAYFLGLGLTSAVNLLNPEIIIAAGGLSNRKEVFWNKVLFFITKTAVSASVKELTLIPAALGEKSGVTGMLSLLDNHMHKRM